MIVWEWTLPPELMHVQPENATSSVPDQYLDEEKYESHSFFIRETDTPCTVYLNKIWKTEFFDQVEDLPRIDEEWIKEFGVGQPTVLVVVYVDMPQRIIEEAKALGDKFFTSRFLPSEDGFDYL